MSLVLHCHTLSSKLRSAASAARFQSSTNNPSEAERIRALVDCARYPLDDAGSPGYAAVVHEARVSLASSGCASFPGFLAPAALHAAAAEARAKAPASFATDAMHNAYQLPGVDLALPVDHIRNVRMRTRVASTAFDELDPRGALRSLYSSDELLRFVRDVLGKELSVNKSKALGGSGGGVVGGGAAPLYRLVDPLGACTVNVFRPGWSHAWHFDEAEATTTLCLQQAEAGGVFEFTPPLRETAGDLAAAAVAAVVNAHSDYAVTCSGGGGCNGNAYSSAVPPSSPRGASRAKSGGAPAAEPAPEAVPVLTAPFTPGTLQVFAGRYSLHRVTDVAPSATRDRLVAVLCFASEPRLRNSPEVQEMFWGRRSAD